MTTRRRRRLKRSSLPSNASPATAAPAARPHRLGSRRFHALTLDPALAAPFAATADRRERHLHHLARPPLPRTVRYLYGRDTPPLTITGLDLFGAHLRTQTRRQLPPKRPGHRVAGDDRNWYFPDTTASPPHPIATDRASNSSKPVHRGGFAVSTASTLANAGRLAAQPGDTVTITSTTDGSANPALASENASTTSSRAEPGRGDRANLPFRLSIPARRIIYDTAGDEYQTTTNGREGDNQISWPLLRTANGVFFTLEPRPDTPFTLTTPPPRQIAVLR
jgi:hypothetical protein